MPFHFFSSKAIEPDLAEVAAQSAITAERIFQEVRWETKTCADPTIPVDRKIVWLMEELGEIATAINDNEPEEDMIHEVVQLGALCQAWVASYCQNNMSLDYTIRKKRLEKLAELGMTERDACAST